MHISNILFLHSCLSLLKFFMTVFLLCSSRLFENENDFTFFSGGKSLECGCSVSINYTKKKKKKDDWFDGAINFWKTETSDFPSILSQWQSEIDSKTADPLSYGLLAQGIFLLRPLYVIKCSVLQSCIFPLLVTFLLMVKGINSFLP